MLRDDVGDSVAIFHSFRNEVYHIGIQHEAVLPTIVQFYFKLSCEILGSYRPSWLGYSSGMHLPERSRKFFDADPFKSDGIKQYCDACQTLGNSLAFDPAEMAEALADHMGEIIEQQNVAIDMIATGGPHQYSRDQAVVETFAWRAAFTEEGKKFGRERGFTGNTFEFVKWISENYPFPFRGDPISGWGLAHCGFARKKTRTKRSKSTETS
jgi:hypothetical protein